MNIPVTSDERWIELSKQNASKRLLEWGILPTEKNIARFHAALRLSVEFPMDLEEIRQLVLNCESIPPPIDGLKNGSDYRASFLGFPLYGRIAPSKTK